MIELSRSLNFRVVAEHVEDQFSLDTVRSMGIDFVQGFAIGRPQRLCRSRPGTACRSPTDLITQGQIHITNCYGVPDPVQGKIAQ